MDGLWFQTVEAYGMDTARQRAAGTLHERGRGELHIPGRTGQIALILWPEAAYLKGDTSIMSDPLRPSKKKDKEVQDEVRRLVGVPPEKKTKGSFLGHEYDIVIIGYAFFMSGFTSGLYMHTSKNRVLGFDILRKPTIGTHDSFSEHATARLSGRKSRFSDLRRREMTTHSAVFGRVVWGPYGVNYVAKSASV